ncbi:MAG: CgeB family protein, partial [Corynebacterium casei]
MVIERQSIVPEHFEDRRVSDKPVWIRRNNRKPDALSIACILDEFSFSSYAPEANFFQLSMDDWKQELESCQPSLLFVESAWRGHNGSWWNQVQRCGPELRSIVEWCNARSIPTAFWNKEDPVHFATFIDTASLFDVVFTTDVDCIPRYRATLNHDNVHFLPFAAQPLYHNPLEEFQRVEGCSFAGAFYKKYGDRNRDFSELVPAIKNQGTFDIYDRNFGTDDETQQFPLEFRENIVGHLMPEDIEVAYKGYTHSLNLNSVKQSQSMFARRVFELLASNTAVISNYSRGLQLLFGDLTIATDGANQLTERLRKISLEPNGRDRIRQAGVRKVFREHTYRHRLHQILTRTGIPSILDRSKDVLLLSVVQSKLDAQRVINSFHRQNYEALNLLLVCDGFTIHGIHKPNISVATDIEAARSMIESLTFNYLGFLDPDSWYGAEYVGDIMDVFSWAGVSRVGHAERYKWDGQGVKRFDEGTAWTIQPAIPLTRSLISTSAEKFLSRYDLDPSDQNHALAVSTLEFCEKGAFATKDALRYVDTPEIDTGLVLNEIQEYGHSLDPALEVLASQPTNLQSPAEILGEENASKYIKYATNELGELEITSTLPEEKHQYIYNRHLLSPFMLPDKQGDEVYLGSTPGLDVMLALVFLDSNKKRVGHTTLYTGRNNVLTWPEETAHIQTGLRVRGSGKTTLKTYSKITAGNSVPLLNLLGDQNSTKAVSYEANKFGELEITSTLPEEKHQYIYNR